VEAAAEAGAGGAGAGAGGAGVAAGAAAAVADEAAVMEDAMAPSIPKERNNVHNQMYYIYYTAVQHKTKTVRHYNAALDFLLKITLPQTLVSSIQKESIKGSK
jgi:hypothetical protein